MRPFTAMTFSMAVLEFLALLLWGSAPVLAQEAISQEVPGAARLGKKVRLEAVQDQISIDRMLAGKYALYGHPATEGVCNGEKTRNP